MRPHGRRPGGFLIARHTRGRTMTTATAGASAPKSSCWASGHWPTLVAALLYFDLAFMVWVILGPLAPAIAEDLGLSPAQTGLMVAVPPLAGPVLRVRGGLPVDRHGPQRPGRDRQVVRDSVG